VISFVHEEEPGQKVISATRVLVTHRGRCGYVVWNVKTEKARWAVVVNTNTGSDTIWQGPNYNGGLLAAFDDELVGYAIANDHSYALHPSTSLAKQLRATSC
jgi:hypothetical protein